MAAPLNALELLQGYRAHDAAVAQRYQQMDQAAQLLPLQIEAQQQNMLAKRRAMEREDMQLNALRQFGQTGNMNALLAGDPKTAIALQGQQQRNSLLRDQLTARNSRPQAVPPGYRMKPDGTMEFIPGGPADPAVRETLKPSEKALPISAAQKLMENQQNLRRADQTVALLEGNDVGEMKGDKEATGKKGLLTNLGVLGDKTLNALDPQGVDTRAAVGDLGSLVIHDRSGAAVTASEFPRLRPFIPLATDSPEVARKKAKRFASEYRAVVDEATEFYKGSGYKVPEGSLRNAAPTAPSSSIDALLEKYK